MTESLETSALTADIVAAYVTNNKLTVVELSALISSVHSALQNAGVPQPEPAPTLTPAVPIKKSVTPDFLISLEDGKSYKSLKRHLNTRGMSPDEYRAKWGLAKDYPMVAANYSAQRSSLAKSLGLGRKAEPTAQAAPAKAPVRRAKKTVAA